MRLFSSRVATLATALSVSAFSAAALHAQDAKPSMRPRIAVGDLLWTMSADRAVIGVTLGAATRSDTAGVRLDEVDANGPAGKAGLKAGDLITDINGVSLRIAAADAEDLATAGVAQRRLQRVLAKAKPGDDVDLRVRSGGATKSVKLKTVSARELERPEAPRAGRISSAAAPSHAVIGVSVGASGSVRDTLGLFLSAVVNGGPAEKAGIVEGDRIAAVNGVDVRVPREDVEDASVASSRVNRFVREVEKATPGAAVTLRVFSAGRYREVTVTPVKSTELPASGFSMSSDDGGFRVFQGNGRTPSVIMGRPMGPGELNDGELQNTMDRIRTLLRERGVNAPSLVAPQVRIRTGLTRM